MGKRDVRVIVVRKRVTAVLLVLVSLSMLWLVWFLSGKTYASEKRGASEEIVTLAHFRTTPQSQVIAASMPLIADVLAFVPWGFLTFMLVDSRRDSRWRSYVATCGGAIVFAIALAVWQYALATRVTSFADTFFNFGGALIGALLAHLRLSVQIRFVV